MLLTDEATVSSKSWTDVEAGRLTETKISGEMNLQITFESSSSQTSEFTTESKSSQGVTTTSAGTTSAASSAEFNITGVETYGGTIVKIEKLGSLIPPENKIITEGETVTTGTITSTLEYGETGGWSDEKTVSGKTTEIDSNFTTSLDSTTEINLEAVDTRPVPKIIHHPDGGLAR